jgi:hypothetical protein
MNELDIPGECPATARPLAPLDMVPAPDSAAGLIVGRVLDSEAAAPVAFAFVRVPALPDMSATADSLGRFRLSLPAGTRHILRIAMIGYQSRADTLQMPVEGGVVLTAQLRPQPMDGPCSGLEMVCRPRPR